MFLFTVLASMIYTTFNIERVFFAYAKDACPVSRFLWLDPSVRTEPFWH